VGSAGQKKGRKHLPKVRGGSGRLADGSSWLGGYYGQKPWGLGGSKQRFQWAPVNFFGWLIAAFVAVVVVVQIIR